MTVIYALETSRRVIELVSESAGTVNGTFSSSLTLKFPPFSVSLLFVKSGAPLTVLLSEEDLDEARKKAVKDEKVVMTENALSFESGLLIDFSKARIRDDYDKREKAVISKRTADEGLELIKEFVESRGTGSGMICAFLEKEGSSSWQDSFGISVYRKILSGLRYPSFCKDPHKTADELAKLEGCGIGLTPSGDDFLSGYLTAMQLASDETGEETGLFKAEIIKNLEKRLSGEKTNTWGWSILKPALDGDLADIVADAVSGVLKKDTENLAELSKIGSSSGFDHIAGIGFALETFSALLS